MKKYFVLLLLILVPAMLYGNRIVVRNQADFDLLQHSVEAALSSSDTLADVRLLPGIYFFRENHLILDGMERPDFHLRISGKGAVLVAISTGREYHLDKGYVDLSTQEPVDVREQVRKAGSWPLPVPFRRGLYMIRLDEADHSEEEVEGCHIILPQWFTGAVSRVEKIRRGCLFFR